MPAGLQRLRRRVPLVVYILVLILAVVMLGIACACITDHPGQTLDRAAAAMPASAAVVEVWSFVIVSAVLVLVPVGRRRDLRGRASPEALQRFLF